MKIGRVCGTVVATILHPALKGRRLLMVQLEDPHGEQQGKALIAVNAVDAGLGDRVLLIDEGNSARQILRAPEAPVRTLIVGVIDEIDEE